MTSAYELARRLDQLCEIHGIRMTVAFTTVLAEWLHEEISALDFGDVVAWPESRHCGTCGRWVQPKSSINPKRMEARYRMGMCTTGHDLRCPDATGAGKARTLLDIKLEDDDENQD